MFIGSSREGRDVALALQAATGDVAEVTCWNQGVFEAGGYTLDSLIDQAHSSDFAVLVATPDDLITSRESAPQAAARDNVVLEFGLFAGVLDRTRTYLLATGPLKLPSDTLGITRLPYDEHRTDGNVQAAVGPAAAEVNRRVLRLGHRSHTRATPGDAAAVLSSEVDSLCRNAETQGWTVKKNDDTTLRLKPPGRRPRVACWRHRRCQPSGRVGSVPTGHPRGSGLPVPPTLHPWHRHAVLARAAGKRDATSVDQLSHGGLFWRGGQGVARPGLGTEGKKCQHFVGLKERRFTVLASCGLEDVDLNQLLDDVMS